MSSSLLKQHTMLPVFYAALLVLCATSVVSAHAPRWAPTWALNESTIIQPCNTTGFLDIDFYSQFAVVDVDWSNAKQLWVVPPMECQELLIEQCGELASLLIINESTDRGALLVFVTARTAQRSSRQRTQSCGALSIETWSRRFRGILPFALSSTTQHLLTGFFRLLTRRALFTCRCVMTTGTLHAAPRYTMVCVARCQFSSLRVCLHDNYADRDQTPGFPHGDGICPGPCDCGGVPCGEIIVHRPVASVVR